MKKDRGIFESIIRCRAVAYAIPVALSCLFPPWSYPDWWIDGREVVREGGRVVQVVSIATHIRFEFLLADHVAHDATLVAVTETYNAKLAKGVLFLVWVTIGCAIVAAEAIVRQYRRQEAT